MGIAQEIARAFFEGTEDAPFGAYGYNIGVYTFEYRKTRVIRAVKTRRKYAFTIASRNINSNKFIWEYPQSDARRYRDFKPDTFDELYNALVMYTSQLPDSQMQTIDDLWRELWD